MSSFERPRHGTGPYEFWEALPNPRHYCWLQRLYCWLQHPFLVLCACEAVGVVFFSLGYVPVQSDNRRGRYLRPLNFLPNGLE